MKKFFKGIGLFIFAILITLAVAGITFATVVTPENAKGWIKNSGAYDGLVDAVIAQAQKDNSTEGDNPLKKPEIQAVAKQALSPAFLQSSVENLIDGTYAWVSGESAEPTFNIDIAKAKQDFAAGLSTYAVTRYNDLPVCARGQRPDTSDFMNIQCRVAGYDIKVDADKKSQEIVAQIELPGGGSNISADTLKQEAQKNGQTVFFANTLFPTIFKINRYFPYIFAGIVALIAVIMILVSKPKKNGIKAVGISLVIASGLLLLTNLGISIALSQIKSRLSTADNPLAVFGQKTGLSIADSLSKTVQSRYTLVAIIFAAIGVSAIVATIVIKSKGAGSSSISKEDTTDKPKVTPPTDTKPVQKPVVKKSVKIQ